MNELSAAENSDTFEKSILSRNALLIFPEFGEALMPSEWERDKIFADHYPVSEMDSLPSSIKDIYIIGGNKGIIDIIERLEFP